jgi:hypothetical protein
MSQTTFALVLALILAWPQARAESTTSAFTKCAQIANDARRLSCYDRLASDLIELGISTRDAPSPAADSATTAGAATTPVAKADTTPQAAQAATQPAPTETAATPQSPAVVAATTPAEPSSTAVEGEFGFERTETKKARELKKIQSRYAGEFNGWDGDTEFPLENGQIWKQIRSGRLAWHADHPMITIDRKGFMGAYRLGVEGVNKKVIVKRIK